MDKKTIILLLPVILLSMSLLVHIGEEESDHTSNHTGIENEYDVNLPEGHESSEQTAIYDGSQRFYSPESLERENYDCSTEADGCVRRELDNTYTECEEVYSPEGDIEDYCETSTLTETVSLKTDERLNHITAPITDQELNIKTHGETFGEDFEFIEPWDVEPLTEDRYLVTGLNGHVYDVKDEEVVVHELDVLETGPRESDQEDPYTGLMGSTRHPEFDENRKIYLHYAYKNSEMQGDEVVLNRVSKFELGRENESLERQETIIDELPGKQYYHGGRLTTGPEERYLYVTTGSALHQEAQNTSFLGGKVLRLNLDGSVPADNPYDNAVYAKGLRNPQGIDFEPETGDMVVSQHGPHRRDNLAKVNKSSNFGWPEPCEKSNPGADYGEEFLCTQTWTLAPSGITYVDDEDHSWHKSVFIAGLRGKHVHRVDFEDGEAIKNEVFWFNGLQTDPYDNYGNRIRDVEYIGGELLVLHDNAFLTRITPG